MAELLIDMLLSPHYGVDEYRACHKQKLKEVTNIPDWMQCFRVSIAIVSLKEPHRIPGYQNLIVQFFIDSQEGHWIVYERHLCLGASATTIIEWSSIDITVWKTAFSERPPSTFQPKTCSHASHLYSPSVATHPLCHRHVNTLTPRPFCKFKHVCYRCIQINIPNKNIRQSSANTNGNGFVAHPVPGRRHQKDHITTLNNRWLVEY